MKQATDGENERIGKEPRRGDRKIRPFAHTGPVPETTTFLPLCEWPLQSSPPDS